ncbi:hypothetical protein ACIA98_31820 [Streptomyces sp. NPDC051366]|uniref:hypothetical protein n=1 Tax=Streptomyces sp. NPDC051366 TaxID=3365652 RepID=UPI0037A7ABD7
MRERDSGDERKRGINEVFQPTSCDAGAEVADIDWVTTELQDLEIQRNTTVPSPYARADAERFVHNANIGQQTTFIITEAGQRAGAISLHLHDERAPGNRLLDRQGGPWPRHRHRSRHQSLPLGLR